MKFYFTLFIFLAVGIFYIVWLDYGCEYGGYMSWDGKQCLNFDDLIKN